MVSNGEQRMIEEEARAFLAAELNRIVFHTDISEAAAGEAVRNVVANAVKKWEQPAVDAALSALHTQLKAKVQSALAR